MKKMHYMYGPVPSRRLGISLGVSPIPKKTCNYSCTYCQLGRTDHMTNTRQMFFEVKDIIKEFDMILLEDVYFDVVTIVGEGEPTLYAGLGELIVEMKKRTSKPIAVITNGALFYDTKVQSEICEADIILPTMDAYDDQSFKTINRPHGNLDFKTVKKGLETFSRKYQGQIWMEIMLIKGVNDCQDSLNRYAEMLKSVRYDKLYLNTPVRPPAEINVEAIDHQTMNRVAKFLDGISIDLLESQGFHSEITDHYESILSIIKRHPMNQFEIVGFLKSRDCITIENILIKLQEDIDVEIINYKGYNTYRLK